MIILQFDHRRSPSIITTYPVWDHAGGWSQSVVEADHQCNTELAHTTISVYNFTVINQTNLHVFGMLEETRILSGCMLTPCRKGPACRLELRIL